MQKSISHEGVVYASTMVYSGPKGLDVPYRLVWIDGPTQRVFARCDRDVGPGDRGMLTWAGEAVSGGWWFQ